MRTADWSAPWFAAVADDARRIDWREPHAALAGLNALAAARTVVAGSGLALRFVDAAGVTEAALSAGARAEPYERRIARTGCVPTRLQGDGFAHDALGALVWLAFPRTKAALNRLHAEQLAHGAGGGATRGALRDAATLFDENALLLALDESRPDARAVVQALRERRWRAALADEPARAAWHAHLVPVAFGHALMQKLVAPFAAITAHAWVVGLPADWSGLPAAARHARLDAILADRLAASLSDRAARLPLPVLGIPGWWAVDRQARLYDDERVFRPPRPSGVRPQQV